MHPKYCDSWLIWLPEALLVFFNLRRIIGYSSFMLFRACPFRLNDSYQFSKNTISFLIFVLSS